MCHKANFTGLPDETIALICQQCRQRPDSNSQDSLDNTIPRRFQRVTSRSLFSHSTTSKLPVPADALALRLVSKRLCRIATPYAWETLDLVLSESDTAYPPCEGVVRTKKRSRSSFDILVFLADNPEIASFIRVFRLDVSPIFTSRISSSVFGKETLDSSVKRHQCITNVIERFILSTRSLYAVHFSDLVHCSATAMRHLLALSSLRLISHTSSYTIITEDSQRLKKSYFTGLDCSQLDAVFSYGHVGISTLLQMAPNLKHVVIEPSFYVQATSAKALPWIKNVVELNVRDIGNAISQIISEKFMDASDAPESRALEQLNITFDDISFTELRRLTSNFSTERLRLLILSSIPPLNVSELSCILNAFPGVTDVVLSANSVTYAFPWDESATLDDYATALAKAKHLRYLEWNNDMPRESDPVDRLAEVAMRCPELKSITVNARRTASSRKFNIIRSQDGIYKNWMSEKEQFVERVSTSWDVSTTPYIL